MNLEFPPIFGNTCPAEGIREYQLNSAGSVIVVMEAVENRLFLDFVDLVRQIKPEMFILENVPGVLSMRKGEAIKEIINCFEDIGYYVNKPLLLKAEHFGVPQLRRRVFIIGSLVKKDIPPPKPLFNFARAREKAQPYESLNDGGLPAAICVKDAIGGIPLIKAGQGEQEMDAQWGRLSDYEKFQRAA